MRWKAENLNLFTAQTAAAPATAPPTAQPAETDSGKK
jgi:hypothetical protein